jgi:hypothetical protein
VKKFEEVLAAAARAIWPQTSNPSEEGPLEFLPPPSSESLAAVVQEVRDIASHVRAATKSTPSIPSHSETELPPTIRNKSADIQAAGANFDGELKKMGGDMVIASLPHDIWFALAPAAPLRMTFIPRPERPRLQWSQVWTWLSHARSHMPER